MQKRDSLKEKENKLAGLFDEYYDRIVRYAYARIGDQRDSEDIASEVFVKALKSLGSFEERGLPMGAWLFKIAHNLVVDYHRKNSHVKKVELEKVEIESDSDPVLDTERKLQMEMVRQAMADLTEDQREVIQLRFFGGLSSAETAALMDKSDGAVREAQSAALKKLRIKLTR
ncbi:RNA polymerase sigma-70 factor, ECF subfamily [Dehalogenimonas formicexedens]|uniref:RNA polymerase sigma-70 factor, ECF subfamily n=1 Tax=Dehalogenimonas formicexedens TaxID=1839801 RepID=A0A1P8F8V4_9CHLR|nr:sigma-70 family RNA polymerase sigma factor [Dehalogenimonas formicexedens]APV44842.1 RNA polymerase sigma-70 factor, ECF subfamily [Dehalogenimonas formicexedens]